MREKSDVFGEAAEEYEAARSGYPDELVADVLAFAAPVHEALEIGAGTGKATRAFISRGFNLTCLEPDPRMAAMLASTSQASAMIEVARFESWHATKSFDLIFAAQSWHWLDPARRLDLARSALSERGTLALFWNRYAPIDADLHDLLARMDRNYGVDSTVHTPHEHDSSFYSGDIVLAPGTPEYEMSIHPGFSDFTSRRYHRSQNYPTDLYIDLLTSVSAYRMLEDSKRADFLLNVEQIIDDNGASLELSISTDLFMSKRL